MTNEERDIISQFITRVGGAPAGGQPEPVRRLGARHGAARAAAGGPGGGRLIRQSFQRYPEAPYRITQLAFVQEHALAEAQNRLQRLEWELQQAQQAAQQAQQQPQQAPQQQAGGSGGGFFSGLFGGRSQSAPPQPGPSPVWNQGAAAPAYQPPRYQQAAPPAAAAICAQLSAGDVSAFRIRVPRFGAEDSGRRRGRRGGREHADGTVFRPSRCGRRRLPAAFRARRRWWKVPGAGARPAAGCRSRTTLTREAGTTAVAPRQRTRMSSITAPGTSPPTTPVAAMPAEAAAIRAGIPVVVAIRAADPTPSARGRCRLPRAACR